MNQILILGGGFAGLRACKLLAKNKLNLNVTLINQNTYHYNSTALHTVAAGTNLPANVEMNIQDLISPKINFIQDQVTDIDHQKQVVILKNHSAMKYDYLFNALGFEPETFGTPGVEENALQIANVNTCVNDYNIIRNRLQKYADDKDPKYISMAVIGGGFTSIELLGELTYQIPRWAQKYHFNPKDFKLYCIAPSFLPMFDSKLDRYAKNFLVKHGVQFITGGLAKRVSNDGVYYGDDNKFIQAKTVFWGAGVQGNHLIKDTGYDQHRNRVAVNNQMIPKAFPNEYLIGDVSAVLNPANQRMYPTTGQISTREADIAVDNFIARLNHKKGTPFTYQSLGTACSLGPKTGIAEVNMFHHTFKFKGWMVPFMKHFINQRTAFEISGLKAALQE
ncbi:NADH dehydrogenase [Philodulcilactobacillus myokoensis]|uniref:NADH dehydrogenase n=1 Tax=Philodulcilactobacillus myokoensis TaxID=2929573 RepID=A0A9W6AZ42_9LACO|nr:NAD(P)/FAD-dependent oxidoreductase [Philodulcilactobacillus myokoensis]GLB46061.1 NADH dehydrogenase [Philodulcilactobacillus myokoensis]